MLKRPFFSTAVPPAMLQLRLRLSRAHCSAPASRAVLDLAMSGEAKDLSSLLEGTQNGRIDVNVGDQDDNTPLIHAASLGAASLFQELIQGAPLEFASMEVAQVQESCPAFLQHQYLDIVECLLRHGADPNLPGASAASPLMWAAHVGFPPMVEILIDAGVNVNGVDADGNTAMLRAVQWSYDDAPYGAFPAVVYLLSQAGASATIENGLGQSPLSVLESRLRSELEPRQGDAEMMDVLQGGVSGRG